MIKLLWKYKHQTLGAFLFGCLLSVAVLIVNYEKTRENVLAAILTSIYISEKMCVNNENENFSDLLELPIGTKMSNMFSGKDLLLLQNYYVICRLDLMDRNKWGPARMKLADVNVVSHLSDKLFNVFSQRAKPYIEYGNILNFDKVLSELESDYPDNLADLKDMYKDRFPIMLSILEVLGIQILVFLSTYFVLRKKDKAL